MRRTSTCEVCGCWVVPEVNFDKGSRDRHNMFTLGLWHVCRGRVSVAAASEEFPFWAPALARLLKRLGPPSAPEIGVAL